MSDVWYGRAWLIWPQVMAFVAITLLFIAPHPPEVPSAPPGWVHSIDAKTLLTSLAALRDQAKTDPAAMTLLAQRATNGDAFAQFFMGTLLDPTIDRAKANPERTTQALNWYRRAAQQNMPIAQANLGLLLAYPRFGLMADYEEAFKWLERAAPIVPAAQREMGLLFRNGHGVPTDRTKAMDLLRAAADRGDAIAQILIGDALDRGTDGLTVDQHEAVLYYQKAALQNNILAQRDLAVHLEKGEGIASDTAKATYWYTRAAAGGDLFSKAKLAGPGAQHTAPAPVTPYSFLQPR